MSSRVTRAAAAKRTFQEDSTVGLTEITKVIKTKKAKNGIMKEETTVEVSVSKSKAKPAKKTSVKAKKEEDLRQLLSNVVIPEDLSLPQSFVELHHPDFVRGMNHILTVDKSLYPVIVTNKYPSFGKNSGPVTKSQDFFRSLCSSVISQQVSGASARAIEKKFRSLFKPDLTDDDTDFYPTPEQVINKTELELREAGLSMRKGDYVKSLAEHFINGELNEELFSSGTEEEIVERLVAVKGIGTWSAKMFLIFALRRSDIFAHDDLGIARGCSRYLTARPDLFKQIKKDCLIENPKKSKFEKAGSKRDWTVYKDEYVEHVGKMFSPHRSALMMIFWRYGDTDIDVLEGGKDQL